MVDRVLDSELRGYQLSDALTRPEIRVVSPGGGTSLQEAKKTPPLGTIQLTVWARMGS